MAQATHFPVWQGFKQEWGYNHRLNRLGDYFYARPDGPYPAEWLHFAASGSGADSCHFETFYHWIQNPNWDTHHGCVSVQLRGKEGDTLTAETAWKLSTQNMAQLYWINGFDIHAKQNQGADKLQYLKVTTEPRFSIEEDMAIYRVKIKAVFNCSTLECDRKDEVGYHLAIYLGLLRIDEYSGYMLENDTLIGQMRWDKMAQKDTILPHNPIEGGENGNFFYPFIRGFEIAIDPEVHYQALGFGLEMEPKLPDQRFKTVFHPFFLFRTGSEEMWDAYRQFFQGWFKPPAKWVVKQSKGKAEIKLFIQKTELDAWNYGNTARYRQGHAEGSLIWHTTHGEQQSPLSPAAMFNLPIKPEYR